MADPRLQWKELRGPDFRDAILASRSAGEGLNDAFDSATSILGRYEAGRTRKNDLEVRQELAGIKDEAGYDKWLAAGGLRGRQVGDEVAGVLSGGRKAVIGFAGDRANISNTYSQIRDRDGRLVIAQDVNTRAQGDWDWNDGARRENARIAAASVGAINEGNYRGNGGAFETSLSRHENGGAGDQYDTLYGHRNRRNGVQVSRMTLGEAMEFSSGNGAYAQDVRNELGYTATPMGKYQIVGTTLRKTAQDLGLPADLPFNEGVQDQLGVYLAQNRLMGPQTQESMRRGMRQEWAGLKNASDAEVDAVIEDVRSRPRVTRDSIIAAAGGGGQVQIGPQDRNEGLYGGTYTGVTSNGGSGPAYGILSDVLAGSQYQTPQSVDAALGITRDAQGRGQAQLDLETQRRAQLDQQLVAESNATTLDDIIRSSGVTSREEGYAWIDGLNIPASEKAAMRQAFDIRAETDPTFAPGSTDPGVISVQESAGQTIAALEHANASSDQNQRLDRIEEFRSDPAGSLETALGGADRIRENEAGAWGNFWGGGAGTYDRQDLDNLITDYTTRLNRAGVQATRETVAAAMYEAYNDDPTSFLGRNSNTLKNRFAYDSVKSLVEQNFSGSSLSEGRERRGVTRQRTADLKAKENTYNTLTTKLEKALRNGNQKEAAKLQEKINKVQGEIADLVKDNQGYLAN